MAGKTKWGHLKGQYPEKPVDNLDYEAKVRGAVDLLKGSSVSDLTLQINTKTDEKKALEERLKYVKFSIEVAEQALRQAMDFAGFDSVVSNGYTWTPTIEPYFSVKDKPSFLAWAHEHASESLTIHDGTLKSIGKAALEGNEPLPDGVAVFLKSSFSRTAKES